MYTIRFFIPQIYVHESMDVKSLPFLPINTTQHSNWILYYDLKLDSMWFECILPFMPTLGLALSNIPTNGYYWDKDGEPTIVDIEYNFKHQLFIAKLEFGIYNQIHILRHISAAITAIHYDA